jgi:Sigma-70 region 2
MNVLHRAPCRDERMADLVSGPWRDRARRGVAIPSRLACHRPAKPGRRGGETAGNRKRHHPDRSPLRGGNVRAGRARHGELASARSRHGQGLNAGGASMPLLPARRLRPASSARSLTRGQPPPWPPRHPAGAGRLAFVSKRQVSATSRYAATWPGWTTGRWLAWSSRCRGPAGGGWRRMAACELLVSRYEGLVRSCVRPYVRSPVSAQDLMQVGYLGLLTAIGHFDPAVGVSLGAYAGPCVSGEPKRFPDARLPASRPRPQPPPRPAPRPRTPRGRRAGPAAVPSQPHDHDRGLR